MRTISWSSALLVTLLVTVVLGAARIAQASQTQVHAVVGLADLLEGEFEGTAISGDGTVRVGPGTTLLADGLPGPVLAIARGGDGVLYVATGTPGRVLKVVGGGRVETIFESDKPLTTALLPLGKDKLVALIAPDGGAAIIDLKTRKSQIVETKEAKMLLGGAVLDDVIYAVGGGDEGVILRLLPGAKSFEVLARTKEAMLRSIAVRRLGGVVRMVVGGGEDGIVYDVQGARVRSLLDAQPGEVSAVAIADDGAVFAALVDGEGKLSKTATSKAKDASDDDDEKKKSPQARKVRGGEVWRISPEGSARLLMQSKANGAYALAVTGNRVLVGTGPLGRIYELDARGRSRPGVLARSKDHNEVTSLLVDAKGGVVAGTAHGGALLSVSSTAAQRGAYLSPALDSEGLARVGTIRTRLLKGSGRVSLRTGNTKEPDDSWSEWSAAAQAADDGVVLRAPPGQYAQVRVELEGGAELAEIYVAYLVENRPPEIAHIDVLAPGWKVVESPRDPPETRSVTFGEKPFAKFLDRRGAQNPTLEERTHGKQSFDVGYRTVYAWVEDADKDALRYRFWLGRVGGGGKVGSWQLVQDWSEAPFVSFEASRLADGEYQVKIDVDDQPTNGARALSETAISAAFVVSHQSPRVLDASAARSKGVIQLRLRAEAALPLVVARCSTGLLDWTPLDPSDGQLDQRSEAFNVELTAKDGGGSVSCEFYDEALNFARVDIPIR